MVEIIRVFEFLFTDSTERNSIFSIFSFRSFCVVKISELFIYIHCIDL